jgi:hypothetical protein
MHPRWFIAILGLLWIGAAYLFGSHVFMVYDNGRSASCGSVDGRTPGDSGHEDEWNRQVLHVRTDLSDMCGSLPDWYTWRNVAMFAGAVIVFGAVVVRLPSKK